MMMWELIALNMCLLVFCTDIFHMVSLLDARSSVKTVGTANNKNSCHLESTRYQAFVIWDVYSLTHLSLTVISKKHVNIPLYRKGNQGSGRKSNLPKGWEFINKNAGIWAQVRLTSKPIQSWDLSSGVLPTIPWCLSVNK